VAGAVEAAWVVEAYSPRFRSATIIKEVGFNDFPFQQGSNALRFLQLEMQKQKDCILANVVYINTHEKDKLLCI